MIIGLVGSTNVGKSTLFNRLIGQFRAIVTDIPGTTRDIIQHTTQIDWLGQVIFADSPGLLDFKSERPFIKKIIDESDLLLFMIDDKVGVTAKEQHIAQYIREKHKQAGTILIINKLDIKWKESQTSLAIADYYSLGFEHIIGISAKNARNLEELQNLIVKLWARYKKPSTWWHSTWWLSTWIAILGKPNVGKSTLLNTFVGKELSKVENISGTTRDYVIGAFNYDGRKYAIYDTAGIKKKASMHGIEKIAYQKTLDMLKFIRPVVLFLIDCTEGLSHRDMTLLEEINHVGLPIIIGLNKTDLINKKQSNVMIKTIQAYLSFAKYIPIIPIVATTGKGIKEMMALVTLVNREMNKRIDTNKLNKVINQEYLSRPPRFPKNKICKILYITQTDIDAPTFMAFVNHKDRANFAFKQRIDNSLRKHFSFIWAPLVIKFKERNEEEQSKPKDEQRDVQRKSKYEERIKRFKTRSASRKS